jgi:hypothetical protein
MSVISAALAGVTSIVRKLTSMIVSEQVETHTHPCVRNLAKFAIASPPVSPAPRCR